MVKVLLSEITSGIDGFESLQIQRFSRRFNQKIDRRIHVIGGHFLALVGSKRCDAIKIDCFRVKDIRNSIDDLFLPSGPESTRWVKFIPIKINVFTWRARRDCLPTRANLIRRGVFMESVNCPICGLHEKNAHRIFFLCDLAQAVLCRICRWLESVVLVCQAHIQHQEPFGRRLQYCLVVHLGFSESSPFR
ncbi:RNA-directed DNA polymerase, eukaryota [Tanacetum coccineum]